MLSWAVGACVCSVCFSLAVSARCLVSLVCFWWEGLWGSVCLSLLFFCLLTCPDYVGSGLDRHLGMVHGCGSQVVSIWASHVFVLLSHTLRAPALSFGYVARGRLGGNVLGRVGGLTLWVAGRHSSSTQPCREPGRWRQGVGHPHSLHSLDAPTWSLASDVCYGSLAQG